MNYNIHIFKKWCKIFLFIAAVLEMIIFPSLVNLYGTVILISGWLFIDIIIIQPKKMKLFPISTMMLIGLGIFNFVLPIPLTLLDFHPVSFNLDIPYITFTHLFLYIIVLVLTHSIYLNLTKGRNVIRIFLRKTNFYTYLNLFHLV